MFCNHVSQQLYDYGISVAVETHFTDFKNVLIWFSAFFPYRIKEFCAWEPWKSDYSLITQVISNFWFLYSTYFLLKVKCMWEASFSLDLHHDWLYHTTQLLEFIKPTIRNIQFIVPIKHTDYQNRSKVRSSMNCYPGWLRDAHCKKNCLYSLKTRQTAVLWQSKNNSSLWGMWTFISGVFFNHEKGTESKFIYSENIGWILAHRPFNTPDADVNITSSDLNLS